MDRTAREAFRAELHTEYAALRARHADRKGKAPLVSLTDARTRRALADPERAAPAPRHPGRHLFDPLPLSELRPLIDWAPFFQAWELAGSFPAILDDEHVGPHARSLMKDAEAFLDRIEADGGLTVRAVAGLFPADCTEADEVTIWRDATRTEARVRVPFLRQQFARSGDRAHQSLADFVQDWDPESDTGDWIGAFAVTAGIGLDDIVRRFEAQHDDYGIILAQAVADRLAEAAAEWLHLTVRTELWAYAPDETLAPSGLLGERFQGIRPAPGYPACPDHTQKTTLFDMLDAEELGLALTESCAMTPTAAVAGWYFAHPDASYFGLGRIGRDQVEDYAERRGWSIAETERWLAPNLGYDPDSYR
jgi:5-methyltetrahydrofolate--homocysteine methyltransferase